MIMCNHFLNNELQWKLVRHHNSMRECDIMDDLNEFDISSEYLPDLTEGKMSEQIAIDEKVKQESHEAYGTADKVL